MRYKLIWSIIVFFFFSDLVAQCPYNVTLRDQTDVDNFLINYPSCTDINGTLEIGYETFSEPDSDITDITGLSMINSVGQDLIVGHLLNLEQFDGLQNLTEIGDDLIINKNYKVRDLDVFANLDSIGGEFRVYLNDSLQHLNGFANLEYIGEGIEISFNRDLKMIGGLSQITHLNEDIYITDSPLLTSLQGLDNITEVNILNGGNGLRIYETGISDLSPLSNLTHIWGGFGDLVLNDNPNLSSLNGLNNLTHIGHGFYVDDCENLSDISQLSNLTYLATNLRFDNTGITSLNGLQNCPVGVGGYIHITYNDQLTSLNGLNPSPTVADNIIINSNILLNDIQSLISIDSIHGGFSSALSINWNSSLVNLDGLDNLEYLGNDFSLNWNAVLDDITALSTLNYVEEDFSITNNASLSECATVCPILLNGTINGSKQVNNNLPGCNSVSEVTANNCVPAGCEVTLLPTQTFNIEFPSCETPYITPFDLVSTQNDCTGLTLDFIFFNSLSPDISFLCFDQGSWPLEILVNGLDTLYATVIIEDSNNLCRAYEHYLSGQAISDTLIGAYLTIESDQSIQNNSNVHYEAGECISLQPDFETINGSEFEAKINTEVCEEF